jgi:hypothetical protein
LESNVAEIEMRPDPLRQRIWWFYWVEREEVVARIDQDLDGRCRVTPQGPNWSPMKTVGGLFDSPSSALREVRLYFARR